MERRLGRGLGSLLGELPAPGDLLELDLDRIRPNPFQPRRSFEPGALEELRQSIQAHGILQPVVVRRAVEGECYELISGERRWRAAKLAGLRTIPATLRPETSNQEMLELALVENLQRSDLDPLERARGFKALMETLQITQEAVAAKVGLKRSSVANHLRLLELPEAAQRAVSAGMVNMGHARALLGLSDERAIMKLLEQAVREDLSVREVERRVKHASEPNPGSLKPASIPAAPPAWAVDLERRLREVLGTKVTLQVAGKSSGRIVIEYFDRPGLDRICDRILPKATV